jgi:predicted transcriptional regulator
MAEAAQLSYTAISEYAERIASHHGAYDARGRADVEALTRALGGRIATGHSSESLHVNRAGDFTVYLPQMTSERRDRFTIAHELGHYFLHYRLPEVTGVGRFYRGEQNPIETQANVFASALLMPARAFRDAFQRLGGDKWALAREFDVSPAAAEVRSQVLGLA